MNKKFLSLNVFLFLIFSNCLNAQVINGNVIWSSDAFISENTIVSPGATLTINNSSTIIYANGFHIEVQSSNDPNVPGGRLILQNCTLTGGINSFSPNTDVWGGIFVTSNGDGTNQFGLPSLSQQSLMVAKATALAGPCASCKVVINLAQYGFANYNPEIDYNGTNTSGGIIQATGAEFKNSEWLIDMKHYQNFKISNPNVKLNDYSFFKKCSFSRGIGALQSNWTSNGLVRLHEVEGVSFLGNSFINYGSIFNTCGILLLNAGAKITRNCNNLNCSNSTANSFSNFTYGIYAENSGTLHRLTVSYNNFNNNKYSIYASGCNFPYICLNNFLLQPIGTTKYSAIALENTKQFTIMNNTVNTVGANSSSLTYGISIVNSGELENEVYKNFLNNLNYSLYADGVNKFTSPTIGLKCKCNVLTNNIPSAYDIAIYNTTNLPVAGIAYTQGVWDVINYKSCSNSFSGTLLNGHSILNNGNTILYYGTLANGFSGGVYVVNADNTTCPTKICDYPCVDFQNPLLTYSSVKSTLYDQLLTTFGTSDFDTVIVDYQDFISKISNIYLGEPENPFDSLRYDLLAQVLDEASLTGNFNFKTTSNITNTKKYLFDYQLLRIGLYIQNHKFDSAIYIINDDLNKFKLYEYQKNQLTDFKNLIEVQKKLFKGDSWNSIPNKDFIRYIANSENFSFGTSLARSILILNEKAIFEPFLKHEQHVEELDPLFKIFPNPVSSILNIPNNIKSYKILDLIGNVVLFNYDNKLNEINVASLRNGIYIIETINNLNSVNTAKFEKL